MQTAKVEPRLWSFWPWRGQLLQILCVMLGDCIHNKLGKCFAASKAFFLHFLSPSVPPAFSTIPSPLTLRSQSFPHFWSIFYALLHHSQLPFTVHYLLPSFTNTLCTFLSFLQSLCFPPSLSHSPSVHYVTFPLLLLVSPLLSLCFLLWLHHPILGHPLTLIFTPHLHCHSVFIPQCVCTAIILLFKCLFKDVIWFLMLTVIFTMHMSASVINNTYNSWFPLTPCLFHIQTY